MTERTRPWPAPLVALLFCATGCAFEAGGGVTRSLSNADLRVAGRVSGTLRSPRGDTPFVGAELYLANTPHVELRGVLLRAGYAWVCPFFCRRSTTYWGVEIGMLGGVGGAPDPAVRASRLDGYHLGAALALPVTVYGGGDASAGFIIGSVAVALVPEVRAGFWGAAGVGNDVTADITGTIALRFFARSDLARAEGYPNPQRSQ